mmetsp:Transcript_36310/g.65385  ORF Transcript_36310/g.65385 Transcript_36310/m.65385 type:complete len:121 (+) Transcript_36310:300-662(+)
MASPSRIDQPPNINGARDKIPWHHLGQPITDRFTSKTSAEHAAKSREHHLSQRNSSTTISRSNMFNRQCLGSPNISMDHHLHAAQFLTIPSLSLTSTVVQSGPTRHQIALSDNATTAQSS